jgi:hypothetical protein
LIWIWLNIWLRCGLKNLPNCLVRWLWGIWRLLCLCNLLLSWDIRPEYGPLYSVWALIVRPISNMVMLLRVVSQGQNVPLTAQVDYFMGELMIQEVFNRGWFNWATQCNLLGGLDGPPKEFLDTGDCRITINGHHTLLFTKILSVFPVPPSNHVGPVHGQESLLVITLKPDRSCQLGPD